MEPVVERFENPGRIRLKLPPIETTLFDLIGAVQEVISPEDEKEGERIVALIVSDLMERGVLKFQKARRNGRSLFA
jgi:hypothetical protein